MQKRENLDEYGKQLDQARANYSNLVRKYIRNLDHMTEEEVKAMQKKLDESGEQYQHAQEVYFDAYVEYIESIRR